jgi:hypothetical protein
LLQELAEEETIDSGEDQPFGSPRGAGDDVDILGAKPALPKQGERLGSRPEAER